MHNKIYFLLSYASIAIKYWCAYFTSLQLHCGECSCRLSMGRARHWSLACL